METAYEHKAVEERWYSFWENSGFFKPRSSGEPFSMVIPPPNVTGALHMGHALNNTLQDIVARYYRLRGRSVLWIPGTDHAGIATQNVVEKQLRAEGLSREMLGRDKFVARVWQWKEQYGDTITRQLRKLGTSVDWSRERFTMDDGCSLAVRENFVRLYNEGLIYRGEYIINWCPRCQTALSDIEVEHTDVVGHLWHIRYPVSGSKDNACMIVATTRPETMFGDMAVAVHPKDKRYKKYIGRKVLLPFCDREIPVIADEHVDAQFGTGAVKVTPAHDPNDYQIAVRHHLPFLKVMTHAAIMNDETPVAYRGLDRHDCREKLVADLFSAGFLEKTVDHNHSVGHCYRCQTVVEPSLSKQWFVAMDKLVQRPVEVVQSEEISFIPDRWKKLYFEWMTAIRPWCISRQIWWGHRIPVWYCETCGKETASGTDLFSCPHCKGERVRQDEDVLDTWFSSALWPFSTLGWPIGTGDLKRYYPTTVLVTGYDIITFWVSRMITMGLYVMNRIPFKDVFVHGLVRDAQGRKMSKSLGNVVDPLVLIDEKGADVLRFTLSSLVTSGGQDIRLSDDKLVSSRNFVNKLWNVSRYILMQEISSQAELGVQPVDRWILGVCSEVSRSVSARYEQYDFNFAIEELYDFVWGQFCDWYVEMTKLHKEASQATLIYVLNAILKMLHPIIPFITEELWQLLKVHPLFPEERNECSSIMVSDWPRPSAVDELLLDTMSLVQGIVRTVRNLKAEMNVPLNNRGILLLKGSEQELKTYVPYLLFLARLSEVTFTESAPDRKHLFAVVGAVEIYLPLEGLIDVEKEKERLQKEAERIEKAVEHTKMKLASPGFLQKAPKAIVDQEKQTLAERQAQLLTLREKINAL